MVPCGEAPIGTRLLPDVVWTCRPGPQPTDRRSGHPGQSQHGSGCGPERHSIMLTVAAGDEDVLDAAVLQFGEHGQPLPCSLASAGWAGPQAQDVAFTVDGDAHRDVDRAVGDLTLADLDVDAVDQQDRVDRVQRAAGPGLICSRTASVTRETRSLDTLVP